MKLEDQVVSLELAKKLKEAGVEQKSLWWWYKEKESKDEYRLTPYCSPGYSIAGIENGEGMLEGYSAFTTAELGEMLPCIIAEGNTFGLAFSQRDEGGNRKRMVAYLPISAAISSLKFINKFASEAEVRGEMYFHLIDENLIPTL